MAVGPADCKRRRPRTIVAHPGEQGCEFFTRDVLPAFIEKDDLRAIGNSIKKQFPIALFPNLAGKVVRRLDL